MFPFGERYLNVAGTFSFLCSVIDSYSRGLGASVAGSHAALFRKLGRLTARGVSSRFFMHCEERIDVVVLDPDRRTPAEDAFLQSLRRVRIT